MSIAAHATRDDKLNWLIRPVAWASNVAFFSAVFGAVYWYFGLWSLNWIVPALCACLGVTAGLLIWAVARMTNASRHPHG
jgi:hypothetical protein